NYSFLAMTGEASGLARLSAKPRADRQAIAQREKFRLLAMTKMAILTQPVRGNDNFPPFTDALPRC
ncbi:MAG: hypothetical protein Q8O01_02400, partial [Candidatus Omnitrophota bacterium]|nr:hypothetical protein [Candidatus Omnitrophota bacterium]